jgi:acetolactate synthase-1/2/3 large subunit
VKLVHVHPGAEELGRVYHPALAINASPTAFCSAAEGLQPPNEIAWRGESDTAHADYLAWTGEPTPQPGAVNLGAVMVWLRDNLPPDAIIANGAGNFAGFMHRYFRFKGYRTQLGSTNGSMGYGYPAAVAAKLAEPKRRVLALCGDGDFLMTGQELATAVQYGANFVAIVVNNGMYGTIRMHQEREYPGRVFGTDLRNPDFAAYARAFGGHGETVERTEDFAPAFERASASGKPAILELKIDPDAISPATTLSAIREKALKSKQ